MANPVVILDGIPFVAHPLKVGALKRAMIGVDEMGAMTESPGNAAKLLDLMVFAVAQSIGKLPEEVENLATQSEIQAAFSKVLTLSGAKEAETGEA